MNEKLDENGYVLRRKAKALVGAFNYPEFVIIEEMGPDGYGNTWFKWPKNSGCLPLEPNEFCWIE
jgi:hypothetical protein